MTIMSDKQGTTSRLVKAHREGDFKAGAELIVRYQEKFWAHAKRLLHHFPLLVHWEKVLKTHHAMPEVCQEAQERIAELRKFCTPQDRSDNTGPRLKPGQRAVALRIDRDDTAKTIRPGNYVDVLCMESVDGVSKARPVLPNIRVLAVEDANPVQPKEKQPVVPVIVTLEVTPEQTGLLLGSDSRARCPWFCEHPMAQQSSAARLSPLDV
jgi:hypothetical protein